MPTVTFIRRIALCLITAASSLLFAVTGHAAEINGATLLRGAAIEGGLIIARTAAGTIVTVDDEIIPTTPDGLFIVGFHRDSNQPVAITITQPDGTSQLTVLTPEQRKYDIQRIDGLQQNYGDTA